MDLSSTRPQDWSYVNEGARNIVVAYSSDEPSPFRGKVLRLPKGTRSFSAEEATSRQAAKEKDLARLLGELGPSLNYVSVPSREWLYQLAKWVQSSRLRLENDVDLHVKNLCCMQNAISSRGISIEIKPKAGFLPKFDYVSAESRDLKSLNCRFCLHRNYKLNRSESRSPGGDPLEEKKRQRQANDALSSLEYCPLNLYSSSREQRIKALNGLWNGWKSIIKSGGNNFRVFIDARLVHPSAAILEKLSTILKVDVSQVPMVLSERLAINLERSKCLDTLKHLQSLYGPVDIEGLHNLVLEKTGRKVDLAKIKSWDELQDTGLFADASDAMNLWSELIQKKGTCIGDTNAGECTLETSRYLVVAYTISTTFKDCSIVVNIGEDSDNHDQVSVIDVDYKNLDRIGHYVRLDQKVIVCAHACITHQCISS